jgi:thiol-disulfide isomerase/thioredoxin/Flp pilus assembly protein TadD
MKGYFMKKSTLSLSIIILLALSLMLCTTKSNSSQLTISPEKAKPGETITFTYIPSDKKLQSRNSFSLYVYSFARELPEVKTVELKKSWKKWTGTYAIDPKAYGLIAKIKLDKENEDNNQGKGYIFALYTGDGKVLPGHKAGLALAYTSWGQLVGINQDLNQALKLTEEDFAANPQIKKEFVNSYLRLLQNIKPEGWDKKLQTFLDEISAQPDLDDSTLTTLYRFYAQMGNQEKALALLQQAQKNPKGEFFQIQAVMQLQIMTDSKQKMEFLKKFQEEFPDSKYVDSIVTLITQGLFQENKLEEANAFLQENKAKAQPYYFYLIASEASKTPEKMNLALAALDNGLSLIEEQLQDIAKHKPAYFTEEEWRDQLETTIKPMLLSLKGNLQMKQGQTKEAISTLEQAYKASQGAQSGIAVDYSRALIQSQNYQPALEVLEKTVKKGFAGQEVMDLLKQSYVGVHKSEEGFDKYQTELDRTATELLKGELEAKMTSSPAPAFELQDLEGQSHKLSDYQGKVVVVDFWATWCGPCLSSFPGMKKLVEEYKNDPSVAFLFINTWQEEANKDQVVKDFLGKNQYPFFVLMDRENKVVAQFGVSGIPTKFIIDPKGKIRFTSVGFEGDTEKMVKEVKLMIDLARKK